MNPTATTRSGALRRTWARLFGESDAIERQLAAIERQLAATAKEGATLARIAHACAFLMLILFSAGSLVALAGDSIQAIAAGRASFPDIIATAVSGLLVACMDTAMLYAASILRLLASRRAETAEGRLHRFVLASVAILEASTYGYMSWRYEHPADAIAWALIAARALAAPLLSVYLSLARPLPVMARDMLALAERISGEGVLRDLAHIAADATAPLVDKVAIYLAAAVLAPEDDMRLQKLLDVAQRREQHTSLIAEVTPAPSDEATDTSEPPEKPPTKPRVRKKRSARRKPTNITPLRKASVEERAVAAWQPGMSIPGLQKAAGISRPSAQKYSALFREREQAQAATEQVNQAAR